MMNRQIRTDLAMEAAQSSGQGELPGVRVSSWETGDVTVTEVVIEGEEGAQLLGKPRGNYITLECPAMRGGSPQGRAAISAVLGEELSRLMPPDDGRPVLVVGLGNREVTPDALGPMTIDRTLVTRHIFRELPDAVDERMRPVCAIAPGVLGVTGMETLEMVSALVEKIGPRAVVAIDSLAARASQRIGTAVQLTDTGIQPGSGVGNHRRALTSETLGRGVKVLAIGVPTVIHAATIVRDAMELLSDGQGDEHEQTLDRMAEELLEGPMGEMIVTPREVDDMIENVAGMVALGINRALHPGLNDGEIQTMMS